MKQLIFESEPIIYTTGAFLKPLKVTDGSGKEHWVWVVSEFTDDSYLEGEVYNPKEFSHSKDDLLEKTDNAPQPNS